MGTAAESIEVARGLLSKWGETVTFQYNSGEVVDAATGAVTSPGVTVSVTGKGYIGRYTADDIDGMNVLSTDGRLIVEKVAVVPQVGWDLLADGRTFRVMSVQKVRKTGTDIVYICQIRAN